MASLAIPSPSSEGKGWADYWTSARLRNELGPTCERTLDDVRPAGQQWREGRDGRREGLCVLNYTAPASRVASHSETSTSPLRVDGVRTPRGRGGGSWSGAGDNYWRGGAALICRTSHRGVANDSLMPTYRGGDCAAHALEGGCGRRGTSRGGATTRPPLVSRNRRRDTAAAAATQHLKPPTTKAGRTHAIERWHLPV